MKRKQIWIMAGIIIGVSALKTAAATISWDSPAYITSNNTDVVHSGGRWAAEKVTGGATTIEGVTFRSRGGFGTILYSSASNYGSDAICPNPSVPDVSDEYRSMLRGVSWQPNGEIYDIALTNLTPGITYKVQIWSSSADWIAIGATITWMDAVSGGNEVTLQAHDESDGRVLGQFAVGTFTADGDVQHIYGTRVGGDAFLNGIQVRDMSLPDGTDDEDYIPPQPIPGPAAISWVVGDISSSDTDVATEGTLLAAETMGFGETTTINGVFFDAMGASGLIDFSSGNKFTGDLLCPPSSDPDVSDAYCTMLKGTTWDDANPYGLITLTNLTIGSTYKVQIWYNNPSAPTEQQYAFCIDSDTGVTNEILFNASSDMSGKLGQYATGTFTAKAYVQMVGLRKNATGGNPAFAGIQVRELGWVPASGYQDWMASYGVTNSAPDADDDSDGADNLYEYALNGDPTNALNTGSAPIIKPDGDSIGYIYLKRNDPDLAYVLRVRSDLVYGDWSTNGFSVTEGIIDSIWKAVTNSVSLSGNDQFFYDLKIEQQ